jgi:uncharacterized protein (DUF58 family)
MLGQEELTTFRRMSLIARRAASRGLGGRSLFDWQRKTMPEGGTEATGHRDYAPGDACRYVDWSLCARRDEILTRTFEGQVDQHSYILLDCSPSMGLGNPPKFELARRMAALLGYTCLSSQDCLSISAFSGRITADLLPTRGKTRIPRMLRFLNELELEGTRTDLAEAAEIFVRRYQRHGPTVVISDLYDATRFTAGLDILRHHGYQPRVVHLYDPADAKPTLLGDMELVDVESRAGRQVTITERMLSRYSQLHAEFHRSIGEYCKRSGIKCLQIATDMPEEEAFLKVVVDSG